jgi:hypothetical protein
VAFLTVFLAGIGFLFCIVPGVYLWISWTLVVPVVLFEEGRGRGALSRSRALVRGRWWPTCGVLGITSLLSALVGGALQGVLLGVSAAGGEVVDAIARAVATSLSSMLTTPFSAAVVTVLYFDMRVRKEGFDLELLARQVGVEPPATGASPFPEEPMPEQPPFWPPPPGWRPGGGAAG